MNRKDSNGSGKGVDEELESKIGKE